MNRGIIGNQLSTVLAYTDPRLSDYDIGRVRGSHFFAMNFCRIDTKLPAHIPPSGDEFEDSIIGYFARVARERWIDPDDFMALLAHTERRDYYRPRVRTEFTNKCVKVFMTEYRRLQ